MTITPAVFDRATLIRAKHNFKLGDSLHLAAAVGAPVVAIFAARNIPRQWFPFGKQHRVVYHRVECWGCGLETCIEQQKKCLMSITVDEVMEAVRAGLVGSKNGGALRAREAGSSLRSE